MLRIIINILVSGLAVFASAYVLPGVKVDSFLTAIIVALVLGLVNVFIKPALVFLTLPVTMLTLGLFIFVINALLVLLVAAIVPGFKVSGFWYAMLFSIVLSFVSWILHSIA